MKIWIATCALFVSFFAQADLQVPPEVQQKAAEFLRDNCGLTHITASDLSLVSKWDVEIDQGVYDTYYALATPGTGRVTMIDAAISNPSIEDITVDSWLCISQGE